MKSFTSVFLRILAALLITSCSSPYEPGKNITAGQYERYVAQLSPYVHKKPDGLSFAERFSGRAASYYQQLCEKTGSKITHFKKADSVNFFFYAYRDHTSLFEHYRGIGGYFKTDERDSVSMVNLLYHTPRFTADEMDEKSEILFDEMVTLGNVDSFIGNKSFVHTPNSDFYYNTQLNKWDYTENSSWSFLKEEQERAGKN